MKKSFIIVAFAAMLVASGSASALNFSKDLSTSTTGYTVVGDSGRYSFSSNGLTAHYDSLADSGRIYFSLGNALTQASSFQFGATLKISSANFEASYFGSCEIAFGLINTTGDSLNATGLNRADNANVFNNLEVDYYPNEFYGWGPNFGITAFGPAASASDDAFADFSSPGSTQFQIGDVSGEVSSLPLDTTLRVHASYDAVTELLTYGVDKWTGATWSALVLYVDPDTNTAYTNVTLNPFEYVSDWNPGISGFNVDAFGISLYNDPYDFSSKEDDDQTLLADVTFCNIYCRTTGDPVAPTIPEPASILLVLSGCGLAVGLLRRK